MVLVVGFPFFGSDDRDDSGSGSDKRNYRPKVIEADQEFVEEIRKREIAAGPVLDLIPYRRERDFDTDRSFFREVHLCRRGGPKRRQNHSVPFAFEPYYDPDEGTVGFRYAADTRRVRTEVRQGLESAYHDSDVEQKPPQFINVEPGQSISAARLTLRDSEALNPINNPGVNPSDFNPDPYEAVTRRMAGTNDRKEAAVVTQMMFMPAISHAKEDDDELNWHHGVKDVAAELREPDESIRWTAVVESLIDGFSDKNLEADPLEKRDPGEKAVQASKLVENQKNKEGYHINVRVIAVSDDPDVARDRVERTSDKYGKFYNATSGQGFEPKYDINVRDLLLKASRRSWIDRGIPFGLDEAVALGAPPTDLSTPSVNQTHRSSDQGTPAGNPDFEEFDETGYVDEWERGR